MDTYFLVFWQECFLVFYQWMCSNSRGLQLYSLKVSYLWYTEKTIFPFPFTLKGYDRGYSFPLNFLNQMEFHLVQNRKENCHHDHIPFNLKGIGILVFSVQYDRCRGGEILRLRVQAGPACNLRFVTHLLGRPFHDSEWSKYWPAKQKNQCQKQL